MKMTLLAMVQDILNDMTSDQVSDINDTIESAQVTQFIKTTYYDLVAELGISGHSEVFQLTAFGDTSNPTKLKMADNVSEMFWLKYNKKLTAGAADDYKEVKYMSPLEFVEHCNKRDSTASNVQKVTGQGIDILIRNDLAPTYWTTFDDDIIVMDSYDVSLENSLQQSKTQAYGILEPTWTQSNTFVPDLPANLFPLFLSRAKLTCQAKIKSIQDPLEQYKERKLKVRYQTTKRRAKESRYLEGPDYGRK